MILVEAWLQPDKSADEKKIIYAERASESGRQTCRSRSNVSALTPISHGRVLFFRIENP